MTITYPANLKTADEKIAYFRAELKKIEAEREELRKNPPPKPDLCEVFRDAMKPPSIDDASS